MVPGLGSYLVPGKARDRSRTGIVEVGLFEWLRIGVVGMGKGKAGRGVLCGVPSPFQSHRGTFMLGSGMDAGKATGSERGDVWEGACGGGGEWRLPGVEVSGG